MKTRLIIAAALAAASSLAASAALPKVIAHRGYWDTEGSAQNSIRALVKADSIGCHASEFDVWMTSDGVLVVNHDDNINGVHIESSPAKKVLAQKLSNGENVPTLESYLELAAKQPSRIVLELKITFSEYGFQDIIKYAPKGTAVYYLSGDYIPWQIKEMGGAGIDYSLKAMKKHPEWIKMTHDLGMEVNVWTVNDPADMQWCIDNGVDYITTNAPEQLQQLLKNQPAK